MTDRYDPAKAAAEAKASDRNFELKIAVIRGAIAQGDTDMLRLVADGEAAEDYEGELMSPAQFWPIAGISNAEGIIPSQAEMVNAALSVGHSEGFGKLPEETRVKAIATAQIVLGRLLGPGSDE